MKILLQSMNLNLRCADLGGTSSIPEALACACYLSGPNPKRVNFVDFANLIAAKLNSKAEDENVRIQRQMSMLRRVSIGDSEIDVEKAKKRWGRMNEMADKAKAVAEKRKADFTAKIAGAQH